MMKRKLLFGVIIILALTLFTQVFELKCPALGENTIGVVRINAGNNANVRDKASFDGKSIGEAKAGKEYVLLENTGEWYKIRLDTKTVGWIYNTTAVITQKSSGQKAAPNPDDYSYRTLDDGTLMITYCRNYQAIEIEVPSQIGGKTVSSIADEAFSNCEKIVSVTIPETVKDIKGNPFKGCDSLSIINVAPGHPYLAVIDGVLFSKPDKKLVCYPCTISDSTYTIPYGITAIGDYAFYYCSNLRTVYIPGSVRTIGNSAFCLCYNVTDFVMTYGITEIGESAFEMCSKLNSITIPTSVEVIGDLAFNYCSKITSVSIPSSVVRIGFGAFSYCDSLTDVTILGKNTEIGDSAFSARMNFKVIRDSKAEQYCKVRTYKYTYTDNLDWLN